MDDYFEVQRERDKAFRQRLCLFAELVRDNVRDWLNGEAKALELEAQQLLDDALPIFKPARQQMLDEIQDINLNQLEEAVVRLTERIDEIRGPLFGDSQLYEGAGELYDDPLETHEHLIDSLASVERTQRRLLKIRRTVDKILRPDA